MFIDDATGRLTQLYFAPSEATAAYREVLRRHLALYGRPVALYSDRHSILRINREDPPDPDGLGFTPGGSSGSL